MDWTLNWRSLDQSDDIVQGRQTLVFGSNNLRDTVSALWRNVGENLQSASNLLSIKSSNYER